MVVHSKERVSHLQVDNLTLQGLVVDGNCSEGISTSQAFVDDLACQ